MKKAVSNFEKETLGFSSLLCGLKGFCLIISIIVLTALNTRGQNVAINSTGAAANLSAMLDISSGSSNTLGLLIPRMTYAQRTGIVTLPAAAQGLQSIKQMVFKVFITTQAPQQRHHGIL